MKKADERKIAKEIQIDEIINGKKF